jgi:hypothetical protein
MAINEKARLPAYRDELSVIRHSPPRERGWPLAIRLINDCGCPSLGSISHGADQLRQELYLEQESLVKHPDTQPPCSSIPTLNASKVRRQRHHHKSNIGTNITNPTQAPPSQTQHIADLNGHAPALSLRKRMRDVVPELRPMELRGGTRANGYLSRQA